MVAAITVALGTAPQKFLPSWMLFSATLTTGWRTISNLLRTVRSLVPGDPSGYRRAFS